LKEDSRASYTDLAKELSISDVAVKKRIDKLTSQGIIENFSINLDYKKLGKPLRAFMLLKCIPNESDRVKKHLVKNQDVLQILPTLGTYDFLIEAISEDVEKLRALAEEGIGNIKGVTEIRTLVVV